MSWRSDQPAHLLDVVKKLITRENEPICNVSVPYDRILTRLSARVSMTRVLPPHAQTAPDLSLWACLVRGRSPSPLAFHHGIVSKRDISHLV